MLLGRPAPFPALWEGGSKAQIRTSWSLIRGVPRACLHRNSNSAARVCVCVCVCVCARRSLILCLKGRGTTKPQGLRSLSLFLPSLAFSLGGTWPSPQDEFMRDLGLLRTTAIWMNSFTDISPDVAVGWSWQAAFFCCCCFLFSLMVANLAQQPNSWKGYILTQEKTLPCAPKNK